MNKTDTLSRLEATLEQRKSANPEDSYVASLYGKGLSRILQKVGEEAVEVLLAAKEAESAQSGKSDGKSAEKAKSSGKSPVDAVIGETADLWFHSMVMLCHLGLSHRQVLAELEKRFIMSGHEEKSSRKH